MTKRPYAPLSLAPAKVCVEALVDGGMVLRSGHPLRPYARCVGDLLVLWAGRARRAAPFSPSGTPRVIGDG